MENVDTALYFPFSIIFNLSTVVIDSLKLPFPCDVFVGVSLTGSNDFFLAGKTIIESAH